MRIAIGSDHAGFELKGVLANFIKELGYETVDVGTYTTDPVDCPDFAEAVRGAVLDGRADRGVLICGSGVGASAAANKIVGIRAGLCHDTYSAHQGVEHDDMNVLVLGGRVVGVATAQEPVRAYSQATFTKEERHMRRLKKLSARSAYAGEDIPAMNSVAALRIHLSDVSSGLATLQAAVEPRWNNRIRSRQQGALNCN